MKSVHTEKTLSTDQLMKRLCAVTSIDAFEQYTDDTAHYQRPLSFTDYIEQKRKSANISPAKLIADAQIQRNYGYQLLNGTKKAGRNKVLAFCIALSLPLDEVQRALTIAKEGVLYAKDQRDAILIFCINQKLSVLETNALLYEKEEELL